MIESNVIRRTNDDSENSAILALVRLPGQQVTLTVDFFWRADCAHPENSFAPLAQSPGFMRTGTVPLTLFLRKNNE